MPIGLELARYMVLKKPESIDGKVISRIETKHYGKDRVQYVRIIFKDGSFVEISSIDDEMLVKVDCAGIYSEGEGGTQ